MLQSALEHYRRQQQLTALALAATRRRGITPAELVRITIAIQIAAAQDALDSIDPMLDEQNIAAPLNGLLVASAFAGTASDGRPLESLFEQAANLGALGLMVVTQIQDTARQAAAVSIASRPQVGYVRMLNPPSCSRCVVQAGKFFKYNEGFLRHNRCDCRHIPSLENVAGDLTTDPRAYFDSLSPAEQSRIFTNAGAEVIRQGADIAQVVNARRKTAGMSFAQVSPIKRDARGNLFTTEGSTRRGIAGQQQAGLRRNGPQQARLMPETILKAAKDRDDAQRLLKLYGYVLDAPAAARGRTVFAQARREEQANRARARRAKKRSAMQTRRDASGGGSNPPGGGRVASGGMDDPDEIAKKILADAIAAEPSATKLVASGANLTRGSVERSESRLKTQKSILEKLERFRRSGANPYARGVSRFNDALRYTVVYDDDQYWNAVGNMSDLLQGGGFQIVSKPEGWKSTGYQGFNVTVRDAEGRQFEVQLHTRSSLQASEETHGWYEEQRTLRPNTDRYRELESLINERYAQVPRPDGVPVVP